MNLLNFESSMQEYMQLLKNNFGELHKKKEFDIEEVEKSLAQLYFIKENLDNCIEQTYLLISKITDISNNLRSDNKKDNFLKFTEKHQPILINNIGEIRKNKMMNLYGVNTEFAEIKKLAGVSSINWFAGDMHSPEGLYISILPNLIAQIPFPDMTTKDSKNFKFMSSVCKYGSRDLCSKKHFNNRINNDKICTFVHKGEYFKKVGTESRCPIITFGCHSTFKEDIKKISIKDIRILLMNCLSDLLNVVLWFKENNINEPIILTELDKYQ